MKKESLKEDNDKKGKPFTNIDEQINILKNRHLHFENEEKAKAKLRRYGYYEIINGYKSPFLIDPKDDKKGYKDKTTFEHIFALYILDKLIRISVLSSLEEFEQNFRQVMAYTIAEKISVEQKNYLAKSHYNTGRYKTHKLPNNDKVFKEKVSDRDGTLALLNKITKLNTQPFKHYREKYNNIPPWILAKGLSFGNLVYWFRLSKPNIRNVVISRMLNMDLEAVKNNKNNVTQFFGDVIRLYNNYRNLAAHNGRVYDHRSNLSALQKSSYIYNENRIDVLDTEFKSGTMRSSIGVVLYTLNLFENKTPYIILFTTLKNLLNKYLESYSEDEEYLYTTMELYGPLKLSEDINQYFL